MLNYCFSLKPVLHYGSNYISFRYYESLFGLNVEEFSFVLYSFNNGTECKAIYRNTKGGGLCRQIAEQIERGHSGKTTEMIRRIRIEEHTVTSKQCPKLCEFHASLKKLCLPLRYKEPLLDPPVYDFLFENPEVRYSSQNTSEEVVRIALATYQEMKKCESKQQ